MGYSLASFSKHIGFPADYDTPNHSESEEIDSTSFVPARSSRRSGARSSDPGAPLFPTLAKAVARPATALVPTPISRIAPIKRLYDSNHVVASNRFTTSSDVRGYIPGASSLP